MISKTNSVKPELNMLAFKMNVHNHAQAYNKHLTNEYLDGLTINQLMGYIHESYKSFYKDWYNQILKEIKNEQRQSDKS